MEKEFVNYELAVKLKELGFDELCFVYYKRSNENKPAYPNHGVIQNSVCGNGITAPTFSQAFRWFREKYDLHYEIHHVKSIVKRLKYKPKKVTELVEYTYEVDGALIDVVDTYEEAELACLTKLIEIVEFKSEQ